MRRDILHCDMNNFYASVECRLDPRLRPFPVAVCGSQAERHGIVLARNYAAKACGVSAGDVIWQAKQKCPGLVVVPPHYEEYLKFSRLARRIYEDYTDRVEPYGMDECWLDISGTEELFGTPEQVAHEIRERVKDELGLTISVGVSFNKVFAKLGSDMKKPDAVTLIPQDRFREVVWPLPAEDMIGVGRASSRLLRRLNVRTLGDLAAADPELLRRLMGKYGVMLWNWAGGRDDAPVLRTDFCSPVKSVGHGTTTVKDLETPEQVWLVMLELCQEVAHKLRLHGKCAAGVAIFIRDNALLTRQWQALLELPCQSALPLARAAHRLFTARYGWERPIRSVTVQAIRLLPGDEPRQISLFEQPELQERQRRLDQCVERIRERFGKEAVRNASLLQPLFLPPEHAPVIMPTGTAPAFSAGKTRGSPSRL